MIKTMRTTIPFFLIFAIASTQLVASSVTISGRFTPAPDAVLSTVVDGTLATPKVNGIRVTYCGQTDYTGRHDDADQDGFFQMVKHHPTNDVRVIVTTQTGYELLKNTVSHQVLSKMEKEFKAYNIAKVKEGDTLVEGDGINAPAKVDPDQWYWKVSKVENNKLTNGLSSYDLIIHADPADIFIHAPSKYFAADQDNGQFIIPSEVIRVLRTPKAPVITKQTNLSALVEATANTDSIDPTVQPDDGSKGIQVIRSILGAR